MAELQAIIVFRGRHFVSYLGIRCVKLLQIMSGVIPRNLQKNVDAISNGFPEVHKRGTHTQQRHTDIHTHTHTHTTIAYGEMQCVAFRIEIQT